MKGIVSGCREAGCALVGGETAELPGPLRPGRVGPGRLLRRDRGPSKIIDGRACRKGDAVIGLASSGLHSNGYSLARKAFSETELRGPIGARASAADPHLHAGHPRRDEEASGSRPWPTSRAAASTTTSRGSSRRVWESGSRRDRGRSPDLPLIQKRGGIADREMYRTLNMGIGMAVVVGAKDAGRAAALFTRLGAKAYLIGEVVRGPRAVTIL